MESSRLRPVPLLYPILDAGLLARAGIPMDAFASALRSAGIDFVQYRDKEGSDAEVVERVRRLRVAFPAGKTTVLLNDRAWLCAAAQCDGAHIGQNDLPPEEARRLLGRDALLGFSAHNALQAKAADAAPVDYIAIGPVFATASKRNPDPIVGIAGVAEARRLTRKPLVAIGGITRANCRAVLEAGADSVAVISALVPKQDGSQRGAHAAAQLAQDFLVQLR